MDSEKMIKSALKNGKLIMGKKSVYSAMKLGGLEKVFLASNCPEMSRKELNYYSRISQVEVIPFGGNSVALGQLCGRPFKIIMLGIQK